MFTEQEQWPWKKKLKMHEVIEHETVIRYCEKHVVMLLCHIVLWHDGWNCSVKARMPFRMIPCSQPHNSAPCFFADCRSSMGCRGVSRWGRRMSQNCAPHSAEHSWIPQNLSVLNTPYNVRGARIGTLCSYTGLVATAPEGRWWLPWKEHHSEWNLSSLIRTTVEVTIKWMEASWLSSSEESAAYT
jgi:hypothetical protein